MTSGIEFPRVQSEGIKHPPALVTVSRIMVMRVLMPLCTLVANARWGFGSVEGPVVFQSPIPEQRRDASRPDSPPRWVRSKLGIDYQERKFPGIGDEEALATASRALPPPCRCCCSSIRDRLIRGMSFVGCYAKELARQFRSQFTTMSKSRFGNRIQRGTKRPTFVAAMVRQAVIRSAHKKSLVEITRLFKKRRGRESNPQPPDRQSGALTN